MFQLRVLAPRSPVAVTDVHGRRFNGNSGGGSSAVDGMQPGSLHKDTCPRLKDNAFVQHAIKDTNQVVGIGNKGAHFWNRHLGRMPARDTAVHVFFAAGAKLLNTFFMSRLRVTAERMPWKCSLQCSLSVDEQRRSLFPVALFLPPSSTC